MEIVSLASKSHAESKRRQKALGYMGKDITYYAKKQLCKNTKIENYRD